MQKNILFIALLLISLSYASSKTAEEIFLGEENHPGFINITDKDDIFYWFFPSRNDRNNDPVVLWLTGGPGCSSELAIFVENGPYKINDDLSLKKNDQSWNNKANLIYVDQPVGTGFSNAPEADWVTNEDQVAEDMYKFFVGFMKKFPEFAGRPLFITGESYAGHYVPAISAYVHKQKNADLNLVGWAIGNGLVDPYVQYPQYAVYAKENKLINDVHYDALVVAFKLCQATIKSGVWPIAMYVCQLPMETITGVPVPAFNLYDIRKKCEHPPLCYDFSNIEKFLKRDDVIEALGVKGRKWESCNMLVHTKLMGDWMLDLSPQVKYLLESGVKGLVYSGDQDFICNWKGGEAWTNALEWTGQEDFNKQEYKDWTVSDKKTGAYKESENLVFLRIFAAGHMVPMDQPEAASQMLDTFFGKWDLQAREKMATLEMYEI